jgi:hypothetical protein
LLDVPSALKYKEGLAARSQKAKKREEKLKISVWQHAFRKQKKGKRNSKDLQKQAERET